MMKLPYWVKFKGSAPGCVEAEDAESAMAAVSHLSPVSAERIPYPAEPRLVVDKSGRYGKIPSFCYRPERCAGRSSCPFAPSCTS